MTGRSVFLVAYDVRDAKRLRQIHKKLRGFGEPVQFSIFQCELTRSEQEVMIGQVSEIIHDKEDRVLVVNLGRREGRAHRIVRVLGRQKLPSPPGPRVI